MFRTLVSTGHFVRSFYVSYNFKVEILNSYKESKTKTRQKTLVKPLCPDIVL